ncbi:MAG: type IV toxin-antitoxin system AbiEi family antitoxin domain-containing protein [Actinomycetota bacterium]
MPNLPEAAHQLFAQQHGVAATTQLIDVGLQRRQIEHLSRRGDIRLVIRGVYQTPSVRLDGLGRAAAVCLARPDVVVAGVTAGSIWGFRRLPPDARTHVIAPPSANPAITQWVVAYRTDAIRPADIIARRDGVRITTRERTAFDLARSLAPDDLLSVIEQAMADGRTDEHELRRVAADWLTPRRPWAYTFLDQLDRRLAGGPAESHLEVRVGEALRLRNVRGVVRQFPIDLPRYGAARFDLAVPHLKLAIEIDGHPAHGETSGRRNDRRRDRAARRLGWHVHRISAEDYEHRFDESIEAIVALITARRAA